MSSNIPVPQLANLQVLFNGTVPSLGDFQGFLIEDKLNKLLSPLEKDEQNLMKLDAIFFVSFQFLCLKHSSGITC